MQCNSYAGLLSGFQKLVGSEVDQFPNGSLLNYKRPFDRGYIVNWGTEIDVRLFIYCCEYIARITSTTASYNVIGVEACLWKGSLKY